MKKLLFLALMLGSVGCQNISGPFKAKEKDRSRPSDPLMNPDLEEQQKYGRSRYSYPEDDRNIGPSSLSGRPTPSGR